MADMFRISGPPGHAPSMPPRITAALDYLRFAEGLRNPPARFDGQAPEARELGPAEQKVYDAALGVLKRYFEDPSPDNVPPPPPEFWGDDQGPPVKDPVRT